MNIRDAVVFFQYAERIKSGLIIASKLVDKVAVMGEEERKGARKLLIHFMNALLGEIRIAYNAAQLNFFKEAGLGLERSIEKHFSCYILCYNWRRNRGQNFKGK